MYGLPGGLEWIIIFLMGMFVYALPLAFVVFVVVFLVKINNTLTDIKKKLDEPEQNQDKNP